MPKRTRDGWHSDRYTSLLTPREREVALLVAAGWSNAQIAVHLVLAENTIKLHVRHVLDKIGVSTRSGLCAHGLHHGHFRLEEIPLDTTPPEPTVRYVHHAGHEGDGPSLS